MNMHNINFARTLLSRFAVNVRVARVRRVPQNNEWISFEFTRETIVRGPTETN